MPTLILRGATIPMRADVVIRIADPVEPAGSAAISICISSTPNGNVENPIENGRIGDQNTVEVLPTHDKSIRYDPSDADLYLLTLMWTFQV